MAPKRANSKAAVSIDDAAKAALLMEKKGKAPIADNIPQEAFDVDAVNSKRQRQDNQPTPEGTARTCSSEGAPQAPPTVFIHPEGGDTIEDGEIIGILAEDQLKLRALCLKDNQLQKQKELLAAKRQRITMQAKVMQMILDEEKRAREHNNKLQICKAKAHTTCSRTLSPLQPLSRGLITLMSEKPTCTTTPGITLA